MLTPSSLTIAYPLIFGALVFADAVLIILIRKSAAKGDKQTKATGNFLTAALILWPVLAVSIGLTVELDFPLLGAMIAIPLLLGAFAMTRHAVIKILTGIALHHLVALGTYRVVGYLFIYIYFDSAALSRGFAMNAGWGDVITGALALPVAWMIMRQVKYAHIALIAWSIFGIGDLIVAPLSAFIYGAGALNEFPLNVIPVFLGPPFGIMLHLITLRVAGLQNRLRPSQGGKDIETAT